MHPGLSANRPSNNWALLYILTSSGSSIYVDQYHCRFSFSVSLFNSGIRILFNETQLVLKYLPLQTIPHFFLRLDRPRSDVISTRNTLIPSHQPIVVYNHVGWSERSKDSLEVPSSLCDQSRRMIPFQ